MSNDSVLANEISFGDFSVLLVEFNRPERLNAVNLDVIKAMNEVYSMCESPSSQVKLLILRGLGRAFSAGGDIRYLSEFVDAVGPKGATTFLTEEYESLKRLKKLKIPTMAVATGPAIGAGFGIFMACKIRIVTPKAIFAMPETDIGIIPDVGATNFLTRLPGSLGLYYALTGNTLSYRKVLDYGLATHLLSAEQVTELLSLSFITPETSVELSDLSALLHQAEPPSTETSENDVDSDSPDQSTIDAVFSAPSIQEVFNRLENSDSEWSKKTLARLRAVSPLSLVLTFRLMRESYEDSADEGAWERAIEREKPVTIKLASGENFKEGVRCKLKDKGDTPKWKPGSLEEALRTNHVRASM